jgi:hypothetical protein
VDLPNSEQCAMTGLYESGKDLWSFPEAGKVFFTTSWG